MTLDAFSVSLIVGWTFMIASLVLPLIIKKSKTKDLYALLLSTFSLGVFVAVGIYQFIK